MYIWKLTISSIVKNWVNNDYFSYTVYVFVIILTVPPSTVSALPSNKFLVTALLETCNNAFSLVIKLINKILQYNKTYH